ncbi:methylated-DNA--[protein]-cysteine S-methyltransferase [Parasutterella excrementihominis]|uniref:methylated-DNA--[protein]-cysteine S-methyltransferase n=1 Tax=Parasutterella excrementihominis TaxID=487175 RepID=UPI003522334A
MRKRPQITTSEAIEPIYISEKSLPCGGALTLGSWNNRLVVADWIDGWHHSTIMNRLQKYTKASVVKSTSNVIEAASDWLDAYFEGSKEPPDFDLLFLGTDYQKHVWQLLLEIPYGETITYGELAQEAGTPKAARAVGVVVGDNPFSIIVRCHRVVGKDKSLTGYGGGFDVKKYLLAHELGTDIENLPFSDCSRRIVG